VTSSAWAAEACGRLAASDPSTYKLACIVSLAARIEHELVRHMRLRFLGYSYVATEARLWFSRLVEARSSEGISLFAVAASELRRQLRKLSIAQQVRDELRQVHASAPPLVQLEEEITWMALNDGSEDAINRRLSPVLEAMARESSRSRDLAAWAVGFLRRLPEKARGATASRVLALGASAHLDTPIELLPGDGTDLVEAAASMFPANVPEVGLVFLGPVASELIVREAKPDETARLTVPRTNPRILEVDTGTDRRVVTFAAGGDARIPFGGPVVVRNVRGARWRLSGAPVPEVRADLRACALLDFGDTYVTAYLVARGILATCAHLRVQTQLEPPTGFATFFQEGGTIRVPVSRIAVSPDDDVALWSLAQDPTWIEPLKLAERRPPIGARLVAQAAGSSHPNRLSIPGIVDSWLSADTPGRGDLLIRLERLPPAVMGVSGAPLLLDGEVVGHVTAVETRDEDLVMMAQSAEHVRLLLQTGPIPRPVRSPEREGANTDYYDSEYPKVFHTCANCSVGSQIPKDRLVEGRPPFSVKDAECMAREASGTCTPHTPEPGLVDFDGLASEYEKIRESPSGPERTRAMTQFVNRVSALAKRFSPAALQAVYERGRDGHRVVALAWGMGVPSDLSVEPVATSLRTARSRFEQWTALRAAETAARVLPVLDVEAYVALVVERLDDPKDWIHERDDTSRLKVARRVVSAFCKSLGIPVSQVDAVRAWIWAGPGHRQGEKRSLVVFGSDYSGRWAPFSRELGGRLAAHGWRVITGRGQDVGTEVAEGYSRVQAHGIEVFTDKGAAAESLENVRIFPSIDEARSAMVQEAECAIVVAGASGTISEYLLARGRSLPVVAVSFTGGTAREVASEANSLLVAAGVPQWIQELLAQGADPALAAECVVRIANLTTPAAGHGTTPSEAKAPAVKAAEKAASAPSRSAGSGTASWAYKSKASSKSSKAKSGRKAGAKSAKRAKKK
jgi:predicted Rossmann-fold nucleotide-binding protein